MKTSILLLALIVINTTALISEPIANLIKGIDTFWLVAFEVLLLIGFAINTIAKGLNTLPVLDLNNINLFVVKAKNKQ